MSLRAAALQHTFFLYSRFQEVMVRGQCGCVLKTSCGSQETLGKERSHQHSISVYVQLVIYGGMFLYLFMSEMDTPTYPQTNPPLLDRYEEACDLLENPKCSNSKSTRKHLSDTKLKKILKTIINSKISLWLCLHLT